MRKSILLLFILLSCSRTSIFRMEGPDDFFKYITDENPNKRNEIKYLNIDLNTNYVFIDFGKWKKYFNKRENNYYWSRNYEIFNEANEKDKNMIRIRLFGSIFFVVGALCLVYFRFKDTTFVEPPEI